MSIITTKHLLSVALSATAFTSTISHAAGHTNPFEMTLLNNGYQTTLSHHQDSIGSENKCEEGKCGSESIESDNKDSEGKCGNRQCDNTPIN